MDRLRHYLMASAVWLFVDNVHHGTLSCTPAHLSHRHEKFAENYSLPKKNMTVLLYAAARNNLLPFIDLNLAQLMQIGSNDLITLLVHLNLMDPSGKEITLKFIIMKNKMIQIGEDTPCDSGNPETLIKACNWAFGQFPSEHTVLILWNHGTGGVEPNWYRAINTSHLYTYNSETKLIEIDKTIGFLDYLTRYNVTALRGICFDDSTKNYLTNHQVGQALKTVRDTVLGGNPLDLVCCDACLMQCLEFAYSLKPLHEKPVARYMVGSQEVVLAKGYPYLDIFKKPSQRPYEAKELAEHIVQQFGAFYLNITRYCTHSAIDLSAIDDLYQAINNIATLLIEGLHHQKNHSVYKFIAFCSAKDRCTHFAEPTYKDLHHLFLNMLKHLATIELESTSRTTTLQQQLHEALNTTCALIKKTVTAHIAGQVLQQAMGLSVYFPLESVHPSYPKTDWGKNSSWTELLYTIAQNHMEISTRNQDDKPPEYNNEIS